MKKQDEELTKIKNQIKKQQQIVKGIFLIKFP